MLPSMSALPPAGDDAQRYARHLALTEVGVAGQDRLRRASVLLIGAGGLGSPAALYLAAAGVGTLGLADFDRVDLSNLQRQVLFATADIGRPKVEAARERLLALNPGIRVVAHAEKVDRAGIAALFAPYDLVIDGCDRLATRYLVNDACVLLRKPLVSAAIHRFEGQAMTYVPGRGPCYRCLFPDGEAALVPSCAEAGVLGVLPGVMGGLQATEALKLLLGIGEPLIGRFLVYDALSLQFQEFRFARRSDCAICGDAPRITSLDPPPEPGLAHIDVWTPQQLAQHLKSAAADSHILIDVREPQEWAAGRIEGSVHIPLGSLPARFAEIPTDRRPVFICAAGARSMAACRFAAQSGRDAINLDGGVYAWAAAFGAPPAP
jgi:sulfur-carrier protein adenylyltransferase/sulfurtransferase